MTSEPDTIAAVATPPGRGGIAVVRISGPAARSIGAAVLDAALPSPRVAAHRRFLDAEGVAIDSGLALLFPAPGSYTGEDVLELHGHGGALVADLVLARVLGLGARVAHPGEFTLRAFLNDRIDLAQAEAVADLVDAASAAAARAAQRTLAGELSRRVGALVESLVAVRVHVEAAIDFPEEEIDFLADARLATDLAALGEALADTRAAAGQGRLLAEGVTVVIAGRPNVGKSSLLNRLAREDAAIVTELPGTTRDVLGRRVHVAGLPVHVLDTAGLRESADPVERLGVDRARAAIGGADAVLLVVEDACGVGPEDEALLAALPAEIPRLVVRNKIDLTGRAAGGDGAEIAISALTGAGIEALEARLAAIAGYRGEEGAGQFSARRRHLVALDEAAAAVARARDRLERERAGELAAEELRAAQRALGEITGEFGAEDLLERIFASFCVGK